MKMDESLKMLQEKLIKYINRNLYTYCISLSKRKGMPCSPAKDCATFSCA